jgi:hypothetical protein
VRLGCQRGFILTVEGRCEVGEGEELVEGSEAGARTAHLRLQLRRSRGLFGRRLGILYRRILGQGWRRARAAPARGAGCGRLRAGVGELLGSIGILRGRRRRRRRRQAEGGSAGNNVQQPPHVRHRAILIVLPCSIVNFVR